MLRTLHASPKLTHLWRLGCEKRSRGRRDRHLRHTARLIQLSGRLSPGHTPKTLARTCSSSSPPPLGGQTCESVSRRSWAPVDSFTNLEGRSRSSSSE